MPQYKRKKRSNGTVVVVSNEMNAVPLSGYTKIDLDIFYSICSQVKNKGTDEVTLRFDKLSELSQCSFAYDKRRFLNAIRSAKTKVMRTQWEYVDEQHEKTINLFEEFDINKVDQEITVRVNGRYIKYFNDLVKEFTRFELAEYVSLGSLYSKQLYRILKQWRMNGRTRMYTVDEIKEGLDTPDYPVKELKRAILKPAVEELKKKRSFKNIWMEDVTDESKEGTGRKPVKGFIFHFDPESIEGQITMDGAFDDIKPDPPKPKRKKKSGKAFELSEQHDYDFDSLEEAITK